MIVKLFPSFLWSLFGCCKKQGNEIFMEFSFVGFFVGVWVFGFVLRDGVCKGNSEFQLLF